MKRVYICSYADLRGANLSGADLRGVDLAKANLRGANLAKANLSDARLRGANLRGANLSGADLWRADLRRVNLSGTDLRGADLRRANLWGANLTDAKLPAFQIPQEGPLIGYKKLANSTICKLKIPAEAKRTASLVGRKCRAEYAEVVEGEGPSMYRSTVWYQKGAVVKPDKYDPDPRVECTHGIHFFLTREEAEEF